MFFVAEHLFAIMRAKGITKMIKINLNQQILIKAARDGKNLTIDQVASDSGVSRITLLRLKAEPTRSTSTDIIDKLCSYFECELHDLVSYEK